MCACGAGRRKAELVIIDPEKRSGDASIKRPRYNRRRPKFQQPGKTVLCNHIDEIFGHRDRRAVLRNRQRAGATGLLVFELMPNRCSGNSAQNIRCSERKY